MRAKDCQLSFARGYFHPFDFVRLALAMVLLLAAYLKVTAWHSAQLEEETLFGSLFFSAMATAMELFLGLWLLLGTHKRLCWFVTCMCFAVFEVVAFDRALSGASSCGCFGKVQVNPWIAFVFDIGVLCVLLSWHPFIEPTSRRVRDLRSHIVPTAATCALPIVGIIMLLTKTDFESSSLPTQHGTVVDSRLATMFVDTNWATEVK
jgi:hypothetical protein